MSKKRIAIISTGGTIEKTYDKFAGTLTNQVSVLDVMLANLELEGVDLVRVPLMNRDSSEMTDGERTLIAKTAGAMAEAHDGVVIVHGTDTLAETGRRICEEVGTPAVAIVLTGAMRPYELRSTDALQNMVESLLAVQVLNPGVYLVMHNKVLEFPGVTKDWEKMTFVKGE